MSLLIVVKLDNSLVFLSAKSEMISYKKIYLCIIKMPPILSAGEMTMSGLQDWLKSGVYVCLFPFSVPPFFNPTSPLSISS